MPTSLFISKFLNLYTTSHHSIKPLWFRSAKNIRVMSTTVQDEISSPDARSQGLLSIFEKNPKRFQRIKFLGNLYNSAGYELRIAGGAVRDILLGVEPQDIDFATTARPEQSLAILEKHEDLLRIIVTASGQKHGTVAVKFKETDMDLKKIKLTPDPNQQDSKADTQKRQNDKPEYDDESPYEITTLRFDRKSDGRHAEVEFINDWKKDAERRDLTINAMFLTLDKGQLIDYFNGASDLKNGVIKIVGDKPGLRLQEDYLRILRFFRFWSRYGRHNQPTKDTLHLLESNLEGLNGISGERIWLEIKKIFGTLPCYEVVELMLELNLFDYLGLEVNDDKKEFREFCLDDLKIAQAHVKEYVTKLDYHDSNSMKKIKELVPIILFSTVVRTTEACLSAHKRMKFSNLERDTINYIVENRPTFSSLTALKHHLAMAARPERPQILQKMKAFLIYKGCFDDIHDLESWEIPNFPLPGNIVSHEIKKRKLPGSHTKSIIESLKTSWASSEYNLSTTQLEKIMLDKLDELTKLR